MRQITCPVCSTDPVNPPESYSIHVCASCGLRWTYLPEEVNTEALYADEVYAVVDNRKSIFERIIFSEAEKVLAKARKIHLNAKSLLDFGSGKGQFLAVAKDAGWQGVGIETAAERADFARKNYQVDVRQEFYAGGKIGDGSFDFITLNHVLEHLPEPLALVSELLDKNLAPGGLVYIEVPRANSWQAAIAGKKWMHWDIPKHLTHWTKSGLEKEFSKIGYRKVASRGLSVHLGILGMVQALLFTFGYKKNLILQLKQRKSPKLLFLIGIVLPFASTIELVSTVFDKSGVFGVYLKKNG